MDGVRVEPLSGVRAVQPKSAVPFGVSTLPTTMRPPNRNSQNDRMFSRGNATSGAPICSGMIALAKPAKVGVAKNGSITVPCRVKIRLYCSLEAICIPGRASSARSNSASTPPTMKKPNEAIRYRCPIFLWSVVVSQETTTLPSERPGTGMGVTGSGDAAMGHLFTSDTQWTRRYPPRQALRSAPPCTTAGDRWPTLAIRHARAFHPGCSRGDWG